MKKDLLKLLDLSREDILHILDTADQMKYSLKHNIPHRALEGKTLAMIFEKNSNWAATPSFSRARRARSAGGSLLRTPPASSPATATAS